MMAESGAAARIATTLISQFGERRVHWAIMFVASSSGSGFFQVGLFYLPAGVHDRAADRPSLVKIGIPLVAGLSVVHGMMPPTRRDARGHSRTRRTPDARLRTHPGGLADARWRVRLRFVDCAAHQLPAENPVQRIHGRQRRLGGTEVMPGRYFTRYRLLPVILMLCASAAVGAPAAAPSGGRSISSAARSSRCSLALLLPLGRWGTAALSAGIKSSSSPRLPCANRHDSRGLGAGGAPTACFSKRRGQGDCGCRAGSHASPLLLAWIVAA